MVPFIHAWMIYIYMCVCGTHLLMQIRYCLVYSCIDMVPPNPGKPSEAALAGMLVGLTGDRIMGLLFERTYMFQRFGDRVKPRKNVLRVTIPYVPFLVVYLVAYYLYIFKIATISIYIYTDVFQLHLHLVSIT